jgi:hypothetical protein
MKTAHTTFLNVVTNIYEWTEWHLTPRGWERGYTKPFDSEQVEELEPPLDKVLTCRYQQNIPINSTWVQKYVSEIWKSPDQKKVAQLLEKFGDCPQKF